MARSRPSVSAACSCSPPTSSAASSTTVIGPSRQRGASASTSSSVSVPRCAPSPSASSTTSQRLRLCSACSRNVSHGSAKPSSAASVIRGIISRALTAVQYSSKSRRFGKGFVSVIWVGVQALATASAHAANNTSSAPAPCSRMRLTASASTRPSVAHVAARRGMRSSASATKAPASTPINGPSSTAAPSNRLPNSHCADDDCAAPPSATPSAKPANQPCARNKASRSGQASRIGPRSRRVVSPVRRRRFATLRTRANTRAPLSINDQGRSSAIASAIPAPKSARVIALDPTSLRPGEASFAAAASPTDRPTASAQRSGPNVMPCRPVAATRVVGADAMRRPAPSRH